MYWGNNIESVCVVRNKIIVRDTIIMFKIPWRESLYFIKGENVWMYVSKIGFSWKGDGDICEGVQNADLAMGFYS